MALHTVHHGDDEKVPLNFIWYSRVQRQVLRIQKQVMAVGMEAGATSTEAGDGRRFGGRRREYGGRTGDSRGCDVTVEVSCDTYSSEWL